MEITTLLSHGNSISSYQIKAISIYDNETIKIYPDLNPMAPQEPQAYPLKKLTELVAYLLDEIEVRERLAKKMK